MNRLPGEQDGGQANSWGHSVSKTQLLVYHILFIIFAMMIRDQSML